MSGKMSPSGNDGTVTKYKVRDMPFIYENVTSPRLDSSPGPRVRKLAE